MTLLLYCLTILIVAAVAIAISNASGLDARTGGLLNTAIGAVALVLLLKELI